MKVGATNSNTYESFMRLCEKLCMSWWPLTNEKTNGILIRFNENCNWFQANR